MHARSRPRKVFLAGLSYLIGKLVHLLSVLFWIGPPLGAYCFLFAAHRSGDRARIVWTERIAERVLAAEHIAFAAMIASGAWLVWLSEGALLAMPWFEKKLGCFAGVFLFEVFDIWISHHVLARVLREPDPAGSPGWRRAMQLRRSLFFAAIPVALLLLPAIFYFAVGKQ
jgi:uncharacterized membrane protein